jgi:hypothetical protein
MLTKMVRLLKLRLAGCRHSSSSQLENPAVVLPKRNETYLTVDCATCDDTGLSLGYAHRKAVIRLWLRTKAFTEGKL